MSSLDNAILETLPNGLRVIVDPVRLVESVFTGLFVDVGSIDETPEMCGVSHFLEHMAFKGTKSRTYQDIAETIEDIGGELNAYTSKSRTVYYTRTLKEHLETSLDLISDIIQNSLYDENEVAKEREVVLQEYFMSQDDPDDLVFDRFYTAAFGVSPLSRPILGMPETIRDITSERLKAYVTRKYCADRMLLVISGNVEPANAIKLADKYFDHLNMPSFSERPLSAYTGGKTSMKKDLEQTHFVLGFPASVIGDRRNAFADTILANILGGGMSSRLFQSVREQHNLVYSISMGIDTYQDTGVGFIYASTEDGKFDETLRRTRDEIRRIQDTAPELKEINRVRAFYKSSLLLSLESTSARAKYLGGTLLNYGRLIPASESLDMIDSITAKDVMIAARRMFGSAETLSVLGPK